MEVRNPKNHRVIHQIGATAQDELGAMAAKARNALPEWQRRSFSERAVFVRRFAQGLEKHLQRLAENQTNETGKPITQALGEIRATVGRIDYFLSHAEDLLEPQIELQQKGLTEQISYEPLGVIANISAWNYPYFVGTNVYIPALLTGNAVLYKPSEWASLVGRDMGDLWQEVGLPPGLFQVVYGQGDIGSRLLDQEIDGVFFTGSYETGRAIAAKAAPRMLKMGLELGGKDPAYVTENFSPVKAAEALADGAFYNNGQSCCAVERIYVHEANYDAFVTAFLNTVAGFKIGDPLDASTYIGPLTREDSIATLLDQIDDAKKKGAHVACGGHRMKREGSYFEPTVLTAVNHTMKVMRDESFGPIIGIQKVADDREASSLMRDTKYGLTASIYTEEKARAESILGQINTGTVYWNTCDRVSPRLPWSGRQKSGLGSTLGKIGIQSFVQPKAWHMRQP